MAYILFQQQVVKLSDVSHDFCKIKALSARSDICANNSTANHLYAYLNAVCRITPLGFLKNRAL